VGGSIGFEGANAPLRRPVSLISFKREGGSIGFEGASPLHTFLDKQSLYFAGGARVNLRTAVSAIGGRLKGCSSSKIGLITSS